MDYKKLLSAAVIELNAAVNKLTTDTLPRTSMPRPRVFAIAAGVTWPMVGPGQDAQWREIQWREICIKTSRGRRSTIDIRWVYSSDIERILSTCRYQPRLILRAIRRIQAATAWCEARAEGRRKQAEEILRQQAKAVEALEAEAALNALK